MHRHRTDALSLAFGLLFATIAAWWLVSRYLLDLRLGTPDVGLFLAGALILVGLLGVAASLRSVSRRRALDITAGADTTAGPNDDVDHPGEADQQPSAATPSNG